MCIRAAARTAVSERSACSHAVKRSSCDIPGGYSFQTTLGGQYGLHPCWTLVRIGGQIALALTDLRLRGWFTIDTLRNTKVHDRCVKTAGRRLSCLEQLDAFAHYGCCHSCFRFVRKQPMAQDMRLTVRLSLGLARN